MRIKRLLLYIIDLCNVSKALDFILFADDTNIFYSPKYPVKLMEIVSAELRKLSHWFRSIELLFILKKSNFIIFKTKQNRQKLDLHFAIDNIEIDRVSEVVFLGVILDEHLSWKWQIIDVPRKFLKSTGIIY